MLFNEMQLKAYYETKKEEMEKEVLARKYSKFSEKKKFLRTFFRSLKNNKVQEKQLEPTPNCCKIQIQEVCCGN